MKHIFLSFLFFGLVNVIYSISITEKIEKVNNAKTTWKAEKYFESSEHFKSLLGSLKSSSDSKLPKKFHVMDEVEIPEHFDASEKWANCASINHIRDQAACGSCWALATAEAITDRICIHSNATITVPVSAEDLMSCCTVCGYGCDGGFPLVSWQYWVDTGIATGGDYGSNEGCRPYSIKACEHHVNGTLDPCGEGTPTPACKKQCDNPTLKYSKELTFGKEAYGILNDIKQIQLEIMTNGPVGAAFTVYEDFEVYKSGIYQRTSDEVAGGHAIKIVGWGVENDASGNEIPYWKVANSWNADWGENGFFRIIRGINDCGIEDEIVAGLPLLK